MRELLMQKCYLDKSNTFRFEGRCSSPIAPSVGHLDSTSGRIHEIDLNRELPAGVEVQLLMGVYYSKSNETNGLALESVAILDSEIRYWGGDSIASRIAHGVAVADMVWVPKYAGSITNIPNVPSQCQPNWCTPHPR